MRVKSVLFWLAVFLIIFITASSFKQKVTHDTIAEVPFTIEGDQISTFSDISTASDTMHFFISSDGSALFSSNESGMGAVVDFINKQPQFKDDNVKGVMSNEDRAVETGKRIFPPDFVKNLKVTRTLEESDGKRHFFYRQTIDGIPIFGAVFSAHLASENDIYAVAGNLLAKPQSIAPSISLIDAGWRAIKQAMTEDSTINPVIRSNSDIFYSGRLIGTSKDPISYPAAEVVITADNNLVPFAKKYVVSRVDGSILYEESLVDEALDRVIYDCDNGVTNCPVVRREGGAVTGKRDVDGAYNYLGDTYNFYKNTFSRDSYDNKGSSALAFVNLTTQTKCPNALWAKAPYSQLVFCSGMVSQDVIAHEFTHGVVENTANLISSNQPGALNEAMADIMAFGVDPDWQLGEDTTLGVIRRADDPPANPRSPHPDRLFSPYYSCSANDSGGIHINLNVMTKGFYLMSEGGGFNGCNLVGIGKEKSLQIWYRALSLYFTQTTNFNYAYRSLLQACTDLYGQNSAECGRTASALQAVEIDQQPADDPQGAKCIGRTAQTPSCVAVTQPPTPTFTITPTPITSCPKRVTGDSDCDNDTDLIDFEIWRKEYLKISTGITADFNGDGQVTLADFQSWRAGYFPI